MASRMFRQEVRALGVLSDGSLVASNREWVYYCGPDEPTMKRAILEEGRQRLSPPMCLTVGPKDRILWGEYDSIAAHGKPVRLYVSDDGGRRYDVARVFEGGSILHIHNLVYDAGLEKYWLLAGDQNHEPGIGLLSADLKDFEWVGKGRQIYRAVDVFDFGDRLVYGMDSEREPDAVLSLDKATGKIERMAEIDGSCIYSCRCGRWYVLSTTVEPSVVNRSRWAGLYVSRDGAKWSRVYEAEKDGWNMRYFQYGSIILPRGGSDRETLLFSGQAVRGIDGRVLTANLSQWGDDE